MKNHYKNYSTIDHERKVFAAVMIVILLALITLFVLEVCGVFDGQVWKPVEEFPIANANIPIFFISRKTSDKLIAAAINLDIIR